MIKKQHLINFVRFSQNYLAIYFPKLSKKFDFRTLNKINEKKPRLSDFAEPELFFVNLLLDSGATVFDIGSNIGLYLYRFQKAGKFKRIIGFEPIPVLYKRLKKYFPDMEIYDFAISDKTEDKTFKIPYIDGKIYETRGTLHNYTEEGETKSEQIKVRTISLDDFVANHNIEDISFIKIDIEGHEIAALRGAKNTLVRFKPLLLIEIEQRHHKELEINDIFTQIIEFGYQGFFFDKADKRFKPIEDFIVNKHQNIQNMNHYYINNFLFVSDSNQAIKENFRMIENLFNNQ